MVVAFAILDKVPLVHTRGYDCHLRTSCNPQIFASRRFRILDSNAPGALVFFAAKNEDIPAKIHNRCLHLVSNQNLRNLIRCIAFCNSPKIQTHTRLFQKDFSRSCIHHHLLPANKRFCCQNFAFRRHFLAAIADIPELYQRPHRRIKCAIRQARIFQSFGDHIEGVFRNLYRLFARIGIDLRNLRAILVRAHVILDAAQASKGFAQRVRVPPVDKANGADSAKDEISPCQIFCVDSPPADRSEQQRKRQRKKCPCYPY